MSPFQLALQVSATLFFFYLMPDFLSLTSSSLLLFSLRAFCYLIMTNGHQGKSLKFKCRFSYLILIAVISLIFPPKFRNS